jgi:hypothetical protein
MNKRKYILARISTHKRSIERLRNLDADTEYLIDWNKREIQKLEDALAQESVEQSRKEQS